MEAQTQTQAQPQTKCKSSSYTYWVREGTKPASAPVPNRIDQLELDIEQQTRYGSAWNKAGTWEEKSLNYWAVGRLKELLASIEPISFPEGSAHVTEVSSCIGDATLVTVRNKKRVGYSFDISMPFRGEFILEGLKDFEGTIKVTDASYGELDELQVEVTLKDESAVEIEKLKLADLKSSFLHAIQAKLLLFEEELKDR